MRRESKQERAMWTDFAREKGSLPPPDQKPLKAHGRQRVEHKNKTESAYESHLNLRKITGEIVWFQFEGLTFKLANDTRYTPDFALLLTDGTLECHEIKGTERRIKKSGESYSAPRFEDDARVKVEVAAAQFPIVFKVVYRVDGNWISNEV